MGKGRNKGSGVLEIRVDASGRASVGMLESHVPFQGKALRHDLARCRPRGRSLERLSFVMGGAAVDSPDKLDAIEVVLEDEPDEDSTLVFGLKGMIDL